MLQPSDHRPNNDIGDDNNNVNVKIEESELKGVKIKSKMETTDSDDATDQADKKKRSDRTRANKTKTIQTTRPTKKKQQLKPNFFDKSFSFQETVVKKTTIRKNRQTNSQTKTLKSYTSQKAVKSTMDLGWNKS